MPIANVTGSDSVAPVLASQGWHMWSYNEVYFHGGPGLNKFVPKVEDYVKDIDNNIDYMVVGIDPVTLHPTLIAKPASTEGLLNNDSIVSNLKGNIRNISSFAYIDKSKTPYRLDVDAGVFVYHPEASYARIYLGANFAASTQIISQQYNANFSSVVSNNIQLTQVALDNVTNTAIKGINSCYTTADLADRTILTLAIYKADNTLIYARQLFVENTAFVRNLGSTDKVITGISIKSSYNSTTVADTLDMPIGTQLTYSNFKGVIHYLDNTTVEMPIDGSKFRIDNLSNVSVLVNEGQFVPIFLVYTMDNNEQAQGATSYQSKTLIKEYKAVARPKDLNHSVKLSAFPRWKDSTGRYELDWFIHTLSREWSFSVPSNKLVFSDTTGIFDGQLFGAVQNFRASVNLASISGTLDNHVHSQNIKVSLYKEGDDTASGSTWLVNQAGSGVTDYINKYCRFTTGATNSTVSLLSYAGQSQTDWMENLYNTSYPIIDIAIEAIAPTPTHIRVKVGNETKVAVPLSQFNVNLTFANANVFVGGNAYVEFIRMDGTEEQRISINALTLKQVSSL